MMKDIVILTLTALAFWLAFRERGIYMEGVSDGYKKAYIIMAGQDLRRLSVPVQQRHMPPEAAGD